MTVSNDAPLCHLAAPRVFFICARQVFKFQELREWKHMFLHTRFDLCASIDIVFLPPGMETVAGVAALVRLKLLSHVILI